MAGAPSRTPLVELTTLPQTVARVVLRRGLMPTVAHIAVNVIVWNVVTDVHTVLMIVVVG